MSLLQANMAGLGGSGAPGGALAGGAVYSYTIDQSLRFDDASNAYLNKTYSTAQTNTDKITASFWFKLSEISTTRMTFLHARNGGGGEIKLNSHKIYANLFDTGYDGFYNNALLRDPSAWYHLVYQGDSTLTQDSQRNRVWLNGVELENNASSYTPQNQDTYFLRNGLTSNIGKNTDNASYDMDGYMAEIHVIDGSIVDVSNFGETVDGVWVPKEYSGSYGNNGFYLSFADSSAIGDDLSGNTNDFTANNLAASDVVKDSPTNSFCTLNPLTHGTYPTLKEGALSIATAYSADLCGVTSTWYPTTGKWYWEIHAEGSTLTYPYFGITDQRMTMTSATTGSYYSVAWHRAGGSAVMSGTSTYMGTITNNNVATWTNDDIIMFALDVDARKLWVGKNGTWDGSGDPAAGTGEDASWTVDTAVSPLWMGYQSQGVNSVFNFGQDGTFAGNQTAQGNSDGNGVGDFYYSPPTGFLAMATNNIDTTIGPGQDTQADDHFETMLYTGNGAGQSIGAGGAQHPQDTITIANSLKFNHADSSFLSYSPGANGATKIMTYSGWIKLADPSKYHILLQAVSGSYDALWIEPTNDKLQVVLGSTSTAVVSSSRSLKNTSKWYHICVNVDTTQATASDRIKIWIDGVQETLTGTQPAQDATFSAWFKSGVTHRINFEGGSTYGNGYIAEVHVAEGTTYDYTYFGQVGSNGYWIPKTVSGITYGDEGFYLDFADSSAIGDDESGNTNDFTTTNTAATDVTIDSPTQNFCTLNPNHYSGIGTFSEGNLKVATTTNSRSTYGTIAVPSSGKWYYEVRVDSNVSGGGIYFGWCTKVDEGDNEYTGDHGITFSNYNEQVLLDGTGQSGGYGSTGTNVSSNGDVYSVLLDVDNGLFYYAKNGTYFNSADPSNGTGGLYVGNIIAGAATEIRPFFSRGGSYNETYSANFGQDPTFSGGETAPATDKTDANGVGKFLYDVPTGFLALMDDNIPVEGIASPDWLWIKERSSASGHFFFDTVRGVHKYVKAEGTATEVTDTTQVQSFDNQGFTVGSSTGINQSTVTTAAWTWKAGGPSPTQTYTVKVVSDSGNKYRFDDFGTSAITLSLQEGGTYTFDQSDSSNATHPLRFSTTSDGTHGGGSEYTIGVTTSGTPGSSGAKTVITVAHGAPTLYYYCSSHSGMGGQANTTETHGSTNVKGSIQAVVTANQDAGLSVVSYTGTGSNGTIGHGLTTAPESIFIKARTRNENWLWYHKFDGGTDGRSFLNLNTTGGKFDNGASGYFQATPPTASVFYQNNSSYNTSTDTYIAYCFHNVEGYCKIGKFLGNSNSNGQFVHLGFRPAWVLIKSTSSGTNSCIFDSKRLGFNVDNNLLRIASATEQTDDDVDFLSNGLKFRRSSTNFNNSSHTYVYIAYAEAPFKFANAR